MLRDVLIKQLVACHGSIRTNVSGIGHEESLITPQPAGNSLNWVVGHVVASRNGLLRLSGLDLHWSKEQARPYIRGSALLAIESARPFDDILNAYEQTQQKLLERLQNMSDAELDAASDKGTLGEQLGFLLFHEAYHAGQVGILRRVLGKAGAIT